MDSFDFCKSSSSVQIASSPPALGRRIVVTEDEEDEFLASALLLKLSSPVMIFRSWPEKDRSQVWFAWFQGGGWPITRLPPTPHTSSACIEAQVWPGRGIVELDDSLRATCWSNDKTGEKTAQTRQVEHSPRSSSCQSACLLSSEPMRATDWTTK
ncbi:uncharacterized protein BJX67DRAFT_8485 [Aspergillus lucknowensis]|uniref:Uncharacterized protein n=1 Tax=Aspergillus lucknowensis TaxID=176173 RepID=A0ABR4M780_9EURO